MDRDGFLSADELRALGIERLEEAGSRKSPDAGVLHSFLYFDSKNYNEL